MENNRIPQVAVLLAAYNGEKYIQEQIKSIVTQINVNIKLYISIDKSTDKTLEICQNLKILYKNIHIINKGNYAFGSAGKNFYFLIKSVDFDEFDFIAFSDQDDIWRPSKIIRGIDFIKSQNFDAYSSDVECFWEDTKKNRILKKSYPQKKYDYFFEAAGPGCTYILKKEFAQDFKKKILIEDNLPFHHDWYIYAYARSVNKRWLIDNQANILYRQHTTNQVGANIGFSQHLKRLKQLINGTYKKQVSEILKSINIDNNQRKILGLSVIKNPFEYRRSKKEAIILFFFAIFKVI